LIIDKKARGSAKSNTAASPSQTVGDPLADALLFLAAHHGRAISREALMAGLPVLDGRLPPPLFERAAAKAGLEGKAVRRKLAEIPALVLPAVLSMRDGSTRILLAIDLDTKMATVVDPSRRTRPQSRAMRELNAEYLGFAFLVRPAASADARAVAAGDLPRAHWFWSVVRRFWSNYSHVAVAALIVNVLALASPLFIMNVYDRVVPNGAMASMVALSIGMGIAVIFDFVIRMVRSRIIDMTGKKLDVIMASNIFEHVLSVKLAQRPASVGIIANQIRDFDSVREFFTSGTVVSVTDLLFAVVFIAVLYMIGGPLAFIPLFMLPVMIVIGLGLQFPLERAMRKLQAESPPVTVCWSNRLPASRPCGRPAPKHACRTPGNARWPPPPAPARKSITGRRSRSPAPAPRSSSIILLMVIIGVFLILDGKITVGVLVASTMLSGRVLAPIAGIATVITRAAQTFITLKAINRIMQLESERPPERLYVARRIEKGSIAFENVSFKYPGSNDAALEKVSFKIAGGERIGIIGRVGSGKTTVGRLVAGFYEPTEAKSSSTTSTRASTIRPICAPASASCCRTPISSSARSVTTSRSESQTQPTRRSSLPRGLPASRTSLPVTRSATTCRSQKAGVACRADKSRQSALPDASSASRRRFSSTSPPRTSTCAARPISLSASRRSPRTT
jgi:ATP-binding cassette subfamily C protein LapB